MRDTIIQKCFVCGDLGPDGETDRTHMGSQEHIGKMHSHLRGMAASMLWALREFENKVGIPPAQIEGWWKL